MPNKQHRSSVAASAAPRRSGRWRYLLPTAVIGIVSVVVGTILHARSHDSESCPHSGQSRPGSACLDYSGLSKLPCGAEIIDVRAGQIIPLNFSRPTLLRGLPSSAAAFLGSSSTVRNFVSAFGDAPVMYGDAAYTAEKAGRGASSEISLREFAERHLWPSPSAGRDQVEKAERSAHGDGQQGGGGGGGNRSSRRSSYAFDRGSDSNKDGVFFASSQGARLLAGIDLHEKELGGLIGSGESVSVLALGRIGTGMPLHNHGPAWLELVAGSKLWFFFEPSACPDFSTRLQADEWVAQSWLPERAADTHGGTHSSSVACVQRASEVMVVPDAWVHATLNLEGEAVLGFGRASQHSQDAAMSLQNHAAALLEKHAWDEIVSILDPLVGSPGYCGPKLYQILGMAHGKRGNVPRARAVYESGLEHNSQNIRLQHSLAIMCKLQRNVSCVREALARVIALDPTFLDPLGAGTGLDSEVTRLLNARVSLAHSGVR
jgi:hypothetical protein